MSVFIVDGFDMLSLGLVIDDDSSGWRDAPEVEHVFAPVPGRYGAARLQRRGNRRVRRLIVNATMVADNVATLRANTSELRRRLMAAVDDTVELRFEESTKYYTALVEACDVTPIAPAFKQKAHRVRISFVCPDPLAYDVDETTADFTAGPADLELGDGPSWADVTVNGPLAGPWQLIYRNAAGEIVSSLTMSGEIDAASGIIIRMREQIITDLLGEQLTPSGEPFANLLIDGDFFAFRPEDADWDQTPTVWPTIEADPVPSGGATAVYQKAWLGI